MKKSIYNLMLIALIAMSTLISQNALAQAEEGQDDDLGDFRGGSLQDITESKFEGGLGYTNIGGESFIGLTLTPELSLGKVGLGIHLPLLYSLDNNEFRTEAFKNGTTGFLRLVRYVRYGRQKKDPIYVRWGQLDNIMVGYGGLINNYSNSISSERTKTGFHLDINFNEGMFGIEAMYSDIDPKSVNLFAIRPYVRPLSKMSIPIIRTLEIGATYIGDKDQTERKTFESDSATTVEQYTYTKDGISAFGVDLGLTLLKIPFVRIDAFGQWSKLNIESDTLKGFFAADGIAENDNFENATGSSVGINARFNFILDVFMLDFRIERLWYDQYYQPQFFDANYEINKDVKILSLGSAEKKAGIYGSLQGHILNKIQIGGSMMIPDEINEGNPALVKLNADLANLADKVSLHGLYQKGGLTDLEDAFKLDERSLATLRVAYHVNKFLRAGVDYHWTFIRSEQEDGSFAFEANRVWYPYFGFSMTF